MIGDGKCDNECNNAECRWDGMDCGCAADCDFSDIQLCLDACLVPSCGYGVLPPHPPCADAVRRTAAKYFQLQKFADLKAFYPFSYNLDKECNEYYLRCDEATWRLAFNECLPHSTCSMSICLNNFGNCHSTDLCAAYANGSYKPICFKCRFPYVNSLGVCAKACSPGLAINPLVPDMCLPIEDFTTEENPQVLYVSAAGNEENADGSKESPFRNLSEALAAVNRKYAQILLVGPEHYLTVTTRSNFMTRADESFPDRVVTNHCVKITIAPADCAHRATFYFPSDHLLTFYAPGPVTTGEYCSPAITRGALEFSNITFVATNQFQCNSDYVLFQVVLNDLILKNVSFYRVSGYDALVLLRTVGRLWFEDVELDAVEACRYLIQQYDAGEQACTDTRYPGVESMMHFTRGKVNVVATNPRSAHLIFLYVVYMRSVVVKDVSVLRVDLGNKAFTFLHLLLVCNLTITNSDFSDIRFREGAAVHFSSNIESNWNQYRCLSLIPKTDSVLIANVTFQKNSYTYGAAVLINFGKVLRNVSLRNCSFLSEATMQSTLITVKGAFPLDKQQITGFGYYVTNSTRIDFPPGYVEIANFFFTNITNAAELFHIENMAHVIIRRVKYKRDKEQSTSCQTAMTAISSYNVTVESISIESLNCSSGPVALSILNSASEFVLKNSNFTDITGSSDSGSIAVFANEQRVLISNTSFVRCRNISPNGKGIVSISNSRRCTEVINSTFTENSAAAAGVFDILNTSCVTLLHCSFQRNSAYSYSGGVALLTASEQTKSTMTVLECIFLENGAVLRGGVLDIEQTPPAATVEILIEKNVFIGNTAGKGAVVYIAAGINVAQTSEVHNCQFSNNTAISEGAVSLHWKSGTLNFINCTFSFHNCAQTACIYTAFSPSVTDVPTLSVHSSKFFSNTGVSLITFANSEVATYFNAVNLTFVNNSAVCISAENAICRLHQLTFFNNSAGSGSCIDAFGNADITVTNSSFTNNFVTGSGGAVQLSDLSSMKCENCLFDSNTAERYGGAIRVEQGSILILQFSSFKKNRCSGDGAALFVLMSTRQSYAEHCSFIENHSRGDGTIVLLSSQLTLNQSSLENNTSEKSTAGVVINLSTFTAASCSFSKQKGVAGGFLYISTVSFVTIIDSFFIFGYSSSIGAIYIEESEITVQNSEFRSLSAAYGSAIYAFGNSKVTILRSLFLQQNNTDGGAVAVLLSLAELQHCEFRENKNSAIHGESADIFIFNSSFRSNSYADGTASTGAGVVCIECILLTVKSSTFQQLNSEYGAGLYIEGPGRQQVKFSISNCQFVSNWARIAGGMYVINANVELAFNTFHQNSAGESGGGVSLQCSVANCVYTLSDNTFVNNTASEKGGAICWEGTQPLLLRNVFAWNTAEYGADISSFAVALRASSTNITNIPSGQTFHADLLLSLIDHYGEVVSVDNSSKLEITSPQNTSVVTVDNSQLTAQRGVFTIGELVITAFPASETHMNVTTTSVETKIVVNLILRECVLGESQVGSRCIVCDPGTYSLDPANLCQDCPKEALCYGNYTVSPRPGYWRSSALSDKFFQCPYEGACLGEEPPTGKCAQGYSGNMCQTCDTNYARISKVYCQPCFSFYASVVRIAAFAVGVVVFCALIVTASIKSAHRAKAIHSIFLKILMNYLQSLMLLGAINMKWPTLTKKLLEAQGAAGGFSEQVFTISCLGEEYNESDQFYANAVLMSLVPVIATAASTLSLMLKHRIMRSQSSIKDELIGASVILFFLAHPCVVQSAFSVFNCEEIDPGEYWIVGLKLRCWQGEHWTYSLGTALPAIIIWGLGVPTIVLGLLYKQRRKLELLSLKIRFGYLFNGYTREKYYWEFVVIYRKLVIISIIVFLTRVSSILQAVLTFSILLYSILLHLTHIPYTREILNTLEFRSLFVSLLTLFTGVYFHLARPSLSLEYFFFSLVIVGNVYFLQFWVRKASAAVIVTLVKRYRFLRKCLVVVDEATLHFTRREIPPALKSEVKGQKPLSSLRKVLFFRKLSRQVTRSETITSIITRPY